MELTKRNMIENWSDGNSRCEISSILWATILLSHTRIRFADGHDREFEPAICNVPEDSSWVNRKITDMDYTINNRNLPEAERNIRQESVFDGVVFNVVSAAKADDLRIRIRAYHRHDGTEFGHPGIMSLEAVDLREWVAIYNMLDRRVKELWKKERTAGGGK